MRIRQIARVLFKGREGGLRRRVLRYLLAAFSASATKQPDSPAPTPGDEAFKQDGGRRLVPLTELAEGEVMELMVDGEPLALCRTTEGVFALDGACPHAGGPLGDGTLDGHTLTCPYHGWAFDITTGACAMDESLRANARPVDVRDGEVWLLADS